MELNSLFQAFRKQQADLSNLLCASPSPPPSNSSPTTEKSEKMPKLKRVMQPTSLQDSDIDEGILDKDGDSEEFGAEEGAINQEDYFFMES